MCSPKLTRAAFWLSPALTHKPETTYARSLTPSGTDEEPAGVEGVSAHEVQGLQAPPRCHRHRHLGPGQLFSPGVYTCWVIPRPHTPFPGTPSTGGSGWDRAGLEQTSQRTAGPTPRRLVRRESGAAGGRPQVERGRPGASQGGLWVSHPTQERRKATEDRCQPGADSEPRFLSVKQHGFGRHDLKLPGWGFVEEQRLMNNPRRALCLAPSPGGPSGPKL